MARRKSYTSLLRALAQELARQEREKQKRLRAQQRESEREKREYAKNWEKSYKTYVKAEKEKKIQLGFANVENLNNAIKERMGDLENILDYALEKEITFSFDSLRIIDKFPPPPSKKSFGIRRKKGIKKHLPGEEQKFQNALVEAKKSYEKALSNYMKEKEAFDLKIKQRNQEVDEYKKDYYEGEPNAVISYCSTILEMSDYPDGFPQEFKMAYLPDSKELVIEYELPNMDIIPTILEHQYLKTKDEIREKLRNKTEIKNLYKDIVTSVSLRTIHEIIKSDIASNIQVITFSGFVETIDPATGHDIRPHLISVRTTADEFLNINLARVDKVTCLRNLGAQVSSKPEEFTPVKPIVDFNMADNRFVDQSDVLSDLESRPNLMSLDPFEFENLVSNLFNQLGFDTKQTRSTKDGGVDAIAFDERPIVGGKLVIQAKRYKNVVGVSAVRDLYGTMINEGANKGILVTTSHYGPTTYEFVKDKPIELIDGGGLLYLLREIGIEARIIFPE